MQNILWNSKWVTLTLNKKLGGGNIDQLCFVQTTKECHISFISGANQSRLNYSDNIYCIHKAAV